MSNDTQQVNVRLKPDEVGMITWLQRHTNSDRVPSITQVVAQAVREKFEREQKGARK